MHTVPAIFFAANRHRKTAVILTGWKHWEEVQGAARCGILMPDGHSANAIGRCTPEEFQQRARAEGYTILTEADQVFIGVYPCGLVYADRCHLLAGDYKRLAFLPYKELTLDLEKDCPPELIPHIQAHAATIIAQRGQEFQISTSGQTIILGQ
jgi:hypothetical protein